MNSEKGFIIHYLKYGENDVIAHCFTENSGFKAFFLKNILGKNSKKKAFLLPFCELDFQLNSKNKNASIQSILKLELVEAKDIYTDIKSNTIVFFVSDILNQLLRNEYQNTKIYQEINVFLEALQLNNYQAHLIFLVQILKIQGVAPLLQENSFLNPESGTFEATITHHLFNYETSNIWRKILTDQNPYHIELTHSERKAFLDSLLVYFHYHISDFKNPISLEVIQEIFE